MRAYMAVAKNIHHVSCELPSVRRVVSRYQVLAKGSLGLA